MSRCFPFPPPGYEKKPRSSSEQGEDLIAKEKHKEKKQKKEKKDKEKREGKERKDKDKSKDKHKEKKDRKEKHKDKKKDKDREKDKSKTPEDRRTEHRSEVHHEGRLGHDSRKAEEVGHFKFTEELGRRIRDDEGVAANRMVEGFSATMHRRPEGIGASATMGKGPVASNRMATDGNSTLTRRDEKLTPLFQKKTEGMEIAAALEKPKLASGGKLPDSTSALRRNENLTPGMETATTLEKQKVSSIARVPDFTSTVRRNENLIPTVQKRIESVGMATAMEKQRSASNQKVGGFNSAEQRNHVTGRPMENLSGSVKRKIDGVFTVNSMQKERPTSNSTVSNPMSMGLPTKRNDGMVQSVESVTSSLPGRSESRGVSPVIKERSVVSNIVPSEQKRTDGMGLPVEKDRQAENATNKKHEGKEKTKEKKAEDARRGGQKDKDKSEKKRKEKDKDRHKEKKKEEKKREKGEHKHTKHNKVRENGMKDQIDTLNNKTVVPHIDNVKTAGADGNSKKRKELEINGFLHEPQYDGRPNKLPRTNASSSHSPVENERLEFSNIASICSIEVGAINNLKAEKGLENNGTYINGKAEVHPPHALFSSVHPVAVDLSNNDQLLPKLPRELGPSVPPVPVAADSSKNEQSTPKRPQVLGSSVLPLVTDLSKGDQLPPKLARPSVSVAPSKIDQVPSRPPHPDNKYLSKIYCVPRMEELVQLDDDQEWLFSSGNPQPDSKLDAEETPQVWAKGLQIEAADVFALPYVVPF